MSLAIQNGNRCSLFQCGFPWPPNPWRVRASMHLPVTLSPHNGILLIWEAEFLTRPWCFHNWCFHYSPWRIIHIIYMCFHLRETLIPTFWINLSDSEGVSPTGETRNTMLNSTCTETVSIAENSIFECLFIWLDFSTSSSHSIPFYYEPGSRLDPTLIQPCLHGDHGTVDNTDQ